MKRLWLAAALLPAPVAAQDHEHMAHDHGAPVAEPAPQPDATADADAAGTDGAPGTAPPPPVAADRAADRYYDAAAMAAAHAAMMADHAAKPYARVTFDLAEVAVHDGQDGYRWEAEGWIGDLDRLVLRSQGEGTFAEGLEAAEVQALWSTALDPWWNLQAGLRQDIRPRPARTWAVLGIAGRAPYQIEVQAAAFLSDKGEVAARIEAVHDMRLTQRLVLQPRGEIAVSAQAMPAQRIGAGLSSAEFGLRLRYEITRGFAPYLGLSWHWLAGRTARYARADGHDPSQASAVAGVRAWF